MDDELELVKSFLAERTDISPDKVVPEATLADIGVDSLLLLETMFDMEEKLGTTIPEGMAMPTTVAELVATIKQLRQSVASKPSSLV